MGTKMQPPTFPPEPQDQEGPPTSILLPAQDSRHLPTWSESETATAQEPEPWSTDSAAASSVGGEKKRIASPPAIQISTSALEANPSTRPSNWLAPPRTNWLTPDSRGGVARTAPMRSVVKQPWDQQLEEIGCGGGDSAAGNDVSHHHADTTQPAHLSALRSRVARLLEGDIPDQVSPASKKLPQKQAHKRPVAPPPEPSDSLKMPTNSLKKDAPGNGVGEGLPGSPSLQVALDDGSLKSPDWRQVKAAKAPLTPPGHPRRNRHPDVSEIKHRPGSADHGSAAQASAFNSAPLAVMLPRTPPERSAGSWGEAERPRPHARGSA